MLLRIRILFEVGIRKSLTFPSGYTAYTCVSRRLHHWSEPPTSSILHSSDYFNFKISTLEDDRGGRLRLTIIRWAKTTGFLKGNTISLLKETAERLCNINILL